MIDRSASVGTRIESETNAAASHLITGVFYRYEAIGRPFIRRSVSVCSRPGARVWYFGGQRAARRAPVSRFRYAALDARHTQGRRLPVLRIFMGAKVKLVAYGVHLLIKYLLTKGNT